MFGDETVHDLNGELGGWVRGHVPQKGDGQLA
jgi:hypothetical protein